MTTVVPTVSVENKEFAAFARRIVRAFARRVASGDVEALPDLLAFAQDLDAATQSAVDGLRKFGYSWPEIAARVGIAPRDAFERWGFAESAKASRTNGIQREAASSDSSQLRLFDAEDGGDW